jgi:hypothetical protein
MMTLTYQRFTAALLLIYGSLFLSGIYYWLRVFWCAATRMSELELDQRMNIKFLVKFGKMLVQVYGDNAMKKTAVYKWMKREAIPVLLLALRSYICTVFSLSVRVPEVQNIDCPFLSLSQLMNHLMKTYT